MAVLVWVLGGIGWIATGTIAWVTSPLEDSPAITNPEFVFTACIGAMIVALADIGRTEDKEPRFFWWLMAGIPVGIIAIWLAQLG